MENESKATESIARIRSRRTPFGVAREISGKPDQKTLLAENGDGLFRLLPPHRNERGNEFDNCVNIFFFARLYLPYPFAKKETTE